MSSSTHNTTAADDSSVEAIHYILTRESILRVCRDTFGMEVIPEQAHEGRCPQCLLSMRADESYCPDGCFRLGHSSAPECINLAEMSMPPVMYNLTPAHSSTGRSRAYHCATCNELLCGYQCPGNVAPYLMRPNFHPPHMSSPDVVRCHLCAGPYSYGNCECATGMTYSSHEFANTRAATQRALPIAIFNDYLTEIEAHHSIILNREGTFAFVSPLSNHYSGVRIEVTFHSTTRSRVIFTYDRDGFVSSAQVKHAIIRYLLTLRNALVIAISGGFLIYHSFPMRAEFTREPSRNRRNLAPPLELLRTRRNRRRPVRLNSEVGNNNQRSGETRSSSSQILPIFNFIGSDVNDRFLSSLNACDATHQRVPQPTNEQLVNASVCAICHETMLTGSDVIRLSCGHIFHYISCLRVWLYQQQKCPLCRQQVRLEDLCGGEIS